MTNSVNDLEYKSIVISDHALMSLNYIITAAPMGPSVWRLSPQWLHDSEFLEFAGTNIVNTDQTSAYIRWEAFKAVMSTL